MPLKSHTTAELFIANFSNRHAKHGSLFRCQRLRFKHTRLFKTIQVINYAAEITYTKGGHVPQAKNINKFKYKETTSSVKINVRLHASTFSLIPSYAMHGSSAPSPVMSINDVPAAQRKIIDQRVIAGPSKTSHQQRKQTVHVSI